MRLYYGERNINRVLDEMEFWKRQEAEHTVVIRKIVDDLEDEYVKQLEHFEKSFYRVEGRALKYNESLIRSKGNLSPVMYQEIIQLINFAIQQSQQFLALLEQILDSSKGVYNNPVAMTVINHIRRESEYFIGIAQTILCNV